MRDYDHKQVCPMALWVLGIGILCGVGTVAALLADVTFRGAGTAIALAWGFFAFSLGYSGAFFYMRVRDGGARLVIAFGPMRLVRASVPYDTMKSVAVSRIDQLRTWQVRGGRPVRVYAARKGEAVKIELIKAPGVRLPRAVFVGTNDSENLVAFLRGKMGGASRDESAGGEPGANGTDGCGSLSLPP